MAQKLAKPKRPVSLDVRGGSLGYNRLDLQVSQVLHMAIELYPNLNYLFVLDYYDDITLFDNDIVPEAVSYYQVKSSEDSISIDTAISEAWLAKLYEHLRHPDWLVQELGLVTNCPLKVSFSVEENGTKKRREVAYSAEKSALVKFNPQVINKIKSDIADRNGIAASDVDLSKFVHMRTTLSIPKHREIVEQEMSGFLKKQYPRITVDAAQTIYYTMMDLLTRRQEYELLDKTASFCSVREKKGFAKDDFSRIIYESMLVAVPPFSEIQRVLQYEEDKRNKAAYEYSAMIEDFQNKSESFRAMFLKVRNLCIEIPYGSGEQISDYCKKIYNSIIPPSPIYSELYVSVLIACVLINEWRRS